MIKYDYLIVGGGMAADAAARAIRSVDTNGSICMFCEESHLPYKRPPLSKKLWFGKTLDSIRLKTEEYGVHMLTGRRVAMLNLETNCVTDNIGETTGYGKLLLATGGTPRKLPFGGNDIIYFRTLDDYDRLRKLAETSESFAVIGGGFIGSEIAAALNYIGKEVTMIMPEMSLCSRNFPPDLGEFVNKYYADKGIKMLFEDSCIGMSVDGEKRILETASGQTVVVDGVVAGIGIRPNVSLAQDAGLAVGDGIIASANLSVGVPDIFAAGDCAAFLSPATGMLTRLEHEDNALKMGKTAGLAMAGQDVRYEYLPMFYSDLFELGYEAVGQVNSSLEVFADWQEEYVTGVLYYLQEGRVRGVLLWNVWDKTGEARELIMNPGPFGPNNLAGRITAG